MNKNFFSFFFIFVSLIFLYSLFSPKIEVEILDNNLILKDMTDKKVFIKKTVQKIMIFPPILWNYLSVEQNDGDITYLAKYIKDEVQQTLLSKIFPSIIDKKEAFTTIGAVPLGVEQILLEKPDIIFSWAWFSNELENIKYHGVIKLINSNEAKEEKLFKLLGKITNKQNRVDYLLKRYDAKMKEIDEKYNIDKKISILVIGKDNYFIWNKNFKIFNQLIQNIGLYNTAQKIPPYNGTTNIETLIVLNPAFIFISGGYENSIIPEDIYKNPAFKSIDAIREKRVYSMPVGFSRMSGPIETPLLMEWMARLSYPKIKWDKPYIQSVKETYKEVYNYEMREEDINQFLRLDVNGNSKDYIKIFKENNVKRF